VNRPALILNILLAVMLVPAGLLAQGDGPRVYWKTLAGANGVTFWPIHTSGNMNPLDPSATVNPDTDIQANLVLMGFHKVLPVAKRSSTLSVIVPMGSIRSQILGPQAGVNQATSGFGDPMVQYSFNLVGAPAIMNLAQYLRYEPRFTLDVVGNLAFPIGEYNTSQRLNLGQNRWYGRIGAPMMYRLGSWVPGKRTTIEALPAVWLFGENKEYGGGTLKSDPLFVLEGHITRDLTESFWGSFDVLYMNGAKPTATRSSLAVTGKSIDSAGVGVTFGYQITDNLQLAASYFATVGDGGPQDMRRDELRFSITYGWHKLLEGMRRIGKH
jgi:hypothetical protein